MLTNKLFKQMKEHFLKAVEIDPLFSKAHFELALVYNSDGNDDSEENHLYESIKLDLAKIEENKRFINKYLEKYQFQNAKFLINKNQEIKIDCSFSFYNLYSLYMRQKKINKAKKQLIKSIELNSSFSKSHRDLGILFYKEKKKDIAEQYLDLALNLNFGDYKSHYYFGMIMKEKSDYKQAEIHFLTSLDIKQNFLLCLMEMANIKLLMNDNDKAIIFYKKAKYFSKDIYNSKLEKLINSGK